MDPDHAAGDTPRTLARTLRGAMHVAFVVLPTVGALRAVTVDAVPVVLGIGAAAVIAAIYLAGSRAALWRGAPDSSARTDLLLPSRGWVMALTLTWMAATFLSSAFVWIAFPLFFLVLFTLGRAAGPLALAAITLWAIATPLIAHEQWTLGIGEILGPVVGAVFSLIAHAVYRRLLHETDRNRQLVAQLRDAQRDLAESQRRKGIAEERQRLAQDIHDTLGQGLNSIVLSSRAARAAHPEASQEFGRIEELARTNLADARHLVRDLADRGPRTTLEQALHTVIARAEQLGGAPSFQLRIDGTPRDLGPEQVETLHHAAQSLVANVQQHAGAQRCVLTLAWWPDRVNLDVVDDGRGFDPSDPARSVSSALTGGGSSVPAAGGSSARPGGPEGGDGLRLLRSRMTRAGGRVAIDSAPGEGTTVGLILPTTAREAGA